MRDLHLAAQGARRQVEALARKAEVPLRCRVVRDEPVARAVDRLRGDRAVERGGAGRAVHGRNGAMLKQMLTRSPAPPGSSPSAPRRSA